MKELWSRYSKEVVPHLNAMNRKWLGNEASLKKNDVVVLFEGIRGRFPLGRVIEVFPHGQDHVGRIADVRVGQKVYRRSLTRLVKLLEASQVPTRLPSCFPPIPEPED